MTIETLRDICIIAVCAEILLATAGIAVFAVIKSDKISKRMRDSDERDKMDLEAVKLYVQRLKRRPPGEEWRDR